MKDYGKVKAVQDVSFHLEPGEVFGLLGPNGAGKTSLISTIVTLEKPTSGQVLVYGFDVTRQPSEAKKCVGFVPQEIVHHGFFNVEEIMRFYSGYFGYWNNQKRIEELLKKLSLWPHRHKKVRQLSGGMKRRLLIAKALSHNPKLILLDEPTAGVDVELRDQLWELIRELQKEGITILLTTHYLEEAEALCQRVGIIHKGKLLALGPTQELIEKFTQREIHICTKEPKSAITHPLLISQEGNRLIFRIPSHQTVGEILKSLQISLDDVVDLQTKEGSLEQAFRRVIGEELSC